MHTSRSRQPMAGHTPLPGRQASRISARSIPPRRSSMAAFKADIRSHQRAIQNSSSKYSSFTESSRLSGIPEDSEVAGASRISNFSDSFECLSIRSVRSQAGSPGGPPSRETKTSVISGSEALRRTLSPFPHQALQGLSPAPGKGLFSFPRRGKQRLGRCIPRLLRRKRPLRILSPWSRLGKWRQTITNTRLPKQECPICTERQSILHFPQRPITEACAHEASICLGCISRSIIAQMETMMWDQLACPLCPTLLTFADMKAWAKRKDFERQVISRSRFLLLFTGNVEPGTRTAWTNHNENVGTTNIYSSRP